MAEKSNDEWPSYLKNLDFLMTICCPLMTATHGSGVAGATAASLPTVLTVEWPSHVLCLYKFISAYVSLYFSFDHLAISADKIVF